LPDLQQKIAIPPLWLLKIRKKTQVHCKGHLQKKTKKAEILIINRGFQLSYFMEILDMFSSEDSRRNFP